MGESRKMATPSIHLSYFAVHINKKGTIAVSHSDSAWNLQLTYTQVILKMMQFWSQNTHRLIHKINLCTSRYGMF